MTKRVKTSLTVLLLVTGIISCNVEDSRGFKLPDERKLSLDFRNCKDTIVPQYLKNPFQQANKFCEFKSRNNSFGTCFMKNSVLHGPFILKSKEGKILTEGQYFNGNKMGRFDYSYEENNTRAVAFYHLINKVSYLNDYAVFNNKDELVKDQSFFVELEIKEKLALDKKSTLTIRPQIYYARGEQKLLVGELDLNMNFIRNKNFIEKTYPKASNQYEIEYELKQEPEDRGLLFGCIIDGNTKRKTYFSLKQG